MVSSMESRVTSGSYYIFSPPDPTECLRHIPVCGSDGVTYHNVCFLLIQKHEVDDGLRLDHYGSCSIQGVRMLMILTIQNTN